ncbi:hypothetical protein J4573_07950 [Actinomadura barringtoniae]|uniref:Uncharacterized protein n=1 Tax=Actinomadura barringtoniae TaxID=1427535 RepID=A0A939PBI7_9ACTN|nr:hypothetical protein [Actinomadura barringtoniae]MBO2447018.1 hypothetical protein [Actinomadura barringtoniae]
MTDSPLPDGDDHQVIRLGAEEAVIVPLEEYRWLRKVHDWQQGTGRVRTNAEEFLKLSGLSEEDQQKLRDKHGI